MEPRFTMHVLTEGNSTALLRIVAGLARHRIHIESLVSTELGASDLYRHTAAVRAAPDRVRRAIKQLSSGVGVLEAGYHGEGDTVDREIGLYVLSIDASAGGELLQQSIRRSRARILVAGSGYVVVEKTGSRDEIEALHADLEAFGILEFVRSGRISVGKPAPGGGAEAEAGAGASTRQARQG